MGGNLLFTLLYLRGVFPLAWWPALLGSALFVLICYRRRIYAESALHLFYVGTALYGLAGFSSSQDPAQWGWPQHGLLLLLGAALTALSAHVLRRHTDAQLVPLDAFTTVFSLLATWLMAGYVHEAWLYWIVIDTAAVVLYAARGLYLGAGLFALYTLMAIDGYFAGIQWFG